MEENLCNSFLIILAVSVVAGTFAASTYDEVNRSFGWSIDTSYDSRFKPVTNIKGKLDGSTETTVDVTNSNYSGILNCENEGDEKVRVTLGGNTDGGSAFYNTNLVYTLTAPANSSEYAKFRIFQDRIIPVGCTQETLDAYVSDHLRRVRNSFLRPYSSHRRNEYYVYSYVRLHSR